MKGYEVKEKLVSSGFKLVDVAQKMGVIPQTFQSLLRTDDIKVGVLQEIAKAIGKDITFFFELENDDSKIRESLLAIEITKNSRRTRFLYLRIEEIDKLLNENFAIKRKGDSSNASDLYQIIFKPYEIEFTNDVESGLEYVSFEKWSFEKKEIYNNRLKRASEELDEIFFERFKMLYKKLREKAL